DRQQQWDAAERGPGEQRPAPERPACILQDQEVDGVEDPGEQAEQVPVQRRERNLERAAHEDRPTRQRSDKRRPFATLRQPPPGMKPHIIRIRLPAFPNSVALASRVRPMPTCQLATSSPNSTPLTSTARTTPRGMPSSGWRFARASSASTGSASAMRQNPAETGPLSANRTNHAPIASAALPASSAASGRKRIGEGAAGIGLV